MVNRSRAQLHNEVTTDGNGVVVSIWRGPQTAVTIRATREAIEEELDALQARGLKRLTLTDITELHPSDASSESRIESKKMLEVQTDAAAVVGGGRMAAITLYIMRTASPGRRMRYFGNRRKALRWLLNITKPQRPKSAISLITAIICGALGISALIGWQLSNQYLMRWLPGLRPINPVAAVGIAIMGFGFLMYWLEKPKYLRMTGVLGLFLGFIALAPLSVDKILFADKIQALGLHTELADSAAVCFILMGILAIVTGLKGRWVHPLQYVLSAIVASTALFNIFGQLYAQSFIYGLSPTFVMAFNLSFAFLIGSSALILLIIYKEHGDVLGLVTRTGWLIVAALVVLQGVTYASWLQSVNRNRNESQVLFAGRSEELTQSIAGRVQTYVDALHGFRGLFAASDNVTQGDFDAYFRTLDLAEHYPGLRTISFVSIVKDSDLPAFVEARKKDTSLFPGGNPKFSIQSKTATPIHYIATYNGQTPNSPTLGIDVNSIPGRAALFDAAVQKGDSYASGTITFSPTATQAAQDGFFISVPVKGAASGDRYVGLVTASFNYADFFPKLSGVGGLLKDLNVTVTDGETGQHVFRSADLHGVAGFSKTATVAVLNQSWDLDLRAPELFGINKTQRRLPDSTLFSGQFLSLLLVVIFIIQGRARRRALDLADAITEDLQHERNRAVELQQKDEAILASIGDAVFAVDGNNRITLFNPAAEQISGYTKEEALGRPYTEVLKFVSEATGKPSVGFVHRALTGHLSSMRQHTQLVRKDGSKVVVADSAAPIHGPHDELLGAIIVFRDVSKEAALDRAKTEFVSLASHQLRTPLSAVNWYVEAMLHGDMGKLTKMQTEYLTEVYKGNQRMVELVSSLLDVSRLDLGRMTNHPKPTDFGALVRDLEKELTSSIETKKTHIVEHIDAKLPAINGDPKLLRMIVQNLMSNAVKYTPEKGTVELTVRRAVEAEVNLARLHRPGPYLYFEVKDTGYGIPKDQQDKIFGKLFRAENVRKMEVEGNGLGLYIVKQVAEKLGGRIWFVSEEGKGTTFSVVIPVTTIVTKVKPDEPAT